MLMSNSCSSPIILLLIVWTTILRLFGPCSATLAPRPWMQSLATGQQHPTWQSVAACFRHSWCLPGYSQVARRMRPAWHFKSFYSTRTSIYTNPIKINLQILNRKRASHSRGTSGGLGFQTWWIVKKKIIAAHQSVFSETIVFLPNIWIRRTTFFHNVDKQHKLNPNYALEE